MNELFDERAPLLPRPLSYIVLAVLATTAVFIVISGSKMDSVLIVLTVAIFAVAILISWFAELRVSVYDDCVVVRNVIREQKYDRDDILDKRCGELSDIRSYSPWSLKGVKHQSFSRVGEDYGVAIKLKGKRVVVISSGDHKALFESIPVEIREESQDA